MSNWKRLLLAGAILGILAWFVASSTVKAATGSQVLTNLIELSAGELFDMANSRYVDGEDVEAAIYLAALISRYQFIHDNDDITSAFKSTILSLNNKLDDLEKLETNYLLASNLCSNGCNSLTADKAFAYVHSTHLESPPDPLPNPFEGQPGGQLICRGGGELGFALEAQPPDSSMWVYFAAGAERGREDHENVYRLEPGQCTLLARRISSGERTQLNLQLLLNDQIAYSVSWDASGNLRRMGPGALNNILNNSPAFDQLGDFSGGQEMAGENTTVSLSVWQAIDDLTNEDRFVEFESVIDENDRFVATDITEYGPWSKYERVEVAFQNGRLPTDDYDGATDSTISQQNSNTNFGNDGICYVDGDDPPNSNRDLSALMRWDISSIPSGSTIKSATITLDIVNESQSQYELYALERNWSEGQATWTRYRNGSAWASNGANGSADRGSAVLGTLSATSTGQHTVALGENGIAEVQSWVESPASNHGFIIDNSASTVGVDFSCSESSSISDRPILTITYSR